ncbi:MAG: MarR family transcriptional regulator [Coriobacteriales bacterium]|nr:MarR family transcriptional regulator [Coriobacteriales bacterium]
MDNELYEKLTQLQWLLHKQRMHDYHHGSHLADVTRGQGRILAALRLQDGISTKDLSYLLELAVSSLNEFLAKLEKSGYITREPSEQDKRVILVKLTEKGKTQQEQPDVVPGFADLFDCLTAEEQTAFGTYLDKVIDALRAKLELGDEETWERWQAVVADKRARMHRGGFGGFGKHGGPGRFGHHGHGHDHGNDKRGRGHGHGHRSDKCHNQE